MEAEKTEEGRAAEWKYNDTPLYPVWSLQKALRYIAIAKGDIGDEPYALYAFEKFDLGSMRRVGDYPTLEAAKEAALRMEAA